MRDRSGIVDKINEVMLEDQQSGLLQDNPKGEVTLRMVYIRYQYIMEMGEQIDQVIFFSFRYSKTLQKTN
jgi:hypothetical protein